MAQTVKHLPIRQEKRVWSLHQEDPLEKEIATHSSILAWKIHGWKSLVGCSPWGRKKPDTTEQLSFFLSFTLHGERLPSQEQSFISAGKRTPLPFQLPSALWPQLKGRKMHRHQGNTLDATREESKKLGVREDGCFHRRNTYESPSPTGLLKD